MSQQFPPRQPYGQPPGYPQQPMGYGMAPPARTSGAAIASLICGILLCIPLITQLLAVILGFVGIRSSSQPGVSGKGMAITGLVLGLLGLLGWIGFGSTVYFGWQQAKKQMAQQAQPFVNAIVSGDVTQARQFTSLSDAELQSLKEQMDGWGQVTSMSMSGFNLQASAERPNTLVMNGNITFQNAGQKKFEIALDTGPQGQFKIISIKFE